MLDVHHLSYFPEVHFVSFETVVWVLNHSDVRGADRLVLIALASHQNGRSARPAVSRLAEETLLGRRSVFRALANLEEAKAIEVVHRGPGRGGTNQYYVRTAKVSECHQYCCKGDRVAPTRVPTTTPKGANDDAERCLSDTRASKSSYEPPKARVTSGHLSSSKGGSRTPLQEEPVNPLGAGAPCLGDPCPDCGEAWTLGHRCDT